MKIKLLCFTARGASLCARLCALLKSGGDDAEGYIKNKEAGGFAGLEKVETDLYGFTKAAFEDGDAVIFVGAVGIAVRAAAPFIKSKAVDPAVVAVDETARYAVPILSGHLGGANALARRVANLIGAEAVVTTATDLNRKFAADVFARENGCAVPAPGEIKYISSAVLEGKTVGFLSDFPVDGGLPGGVASAESGESGVFVSLDTARKPFLHTLHLVPRCVTVGVGCKKGVAEEVLERRYLEALARNGIPACAVAKIATIDIKLKENALAALCKKYRLELAGFTAEELAAVGGKFTDSEFVQRTTGVGNVCERAAVKAGGSLIINKDAGDGVTIAAARSDWRGNFESSDGWD